MSNRIRKIGQVAPGDSGGSDINNRNVRRKPGDNADLRIPPQDFFQKNGESNVKRVNAASK
ncbi:MAG TPA: hypothetical protein PKA41_10530, partial [Verrucomicrobiota bacterium]|nr:hypothetical protein [Verrucomicrobiota bacterium]